MFTVTFSAGAVFSLGLIAGIILGVVGIVGVAFVINKNKNKEN